MKKLITKSDLLDIIKRENLELMCISDAFYELKADYVEIRAMRMAWVNDLEQDVDVRACNYITLPETIYKGEYNRSGDYILNCASGERGGYVPNSKDFGYYDWIVWYDDKDEEGGIFLLNEEKNNN